MPRCGHLFKNTDAYDAWAARWRARLGQETAPAAAMRAVNPAFIPRNHLVEAALAAAVERADFRPFEDLLAVLSRPLCGRPRSWRVMPPRRGKRNACCKPSAAPDAQPMLSL